MAVRHKQASVLWFLLCVTAASAEDVAQTLPSIEQIEQVIEARQAAVKSGRFSWDAHCWLQKGSRSDQNESLDPAGLPNPATDLEFTAERSVVFSDDLVRYENYGHRWHTKQRGKMPFRSITTWDGEKSCVFADPEGPAQGDIYSDPHTCYIGQLRPIGWAYRLQDGYWNHSFDLSAFSVQSQLEEIAGTPCVVIDNSVEKKNGLRRFYFDRLWLSHDGEFLVRRFESVFRMEVASRIDIEYEPSGGGISVPIRWTLVEGAPPRETEQCEVTSYELNVPIDPAVFDFQFPEGTTVRDLRALSAPETPPDDSQRLSQHPDPDANARIERLLAMNPTRPSGAAPEQQALSPLYWILPVAFLLGLYFVARRDN